MSALEEALRKNRQELREDRQSPQKLLEALRANTGKTASLTGESTSHSSGMLGGVHKLVEEAKDQNSTATKTAKDISSLRLTTFNSSRVVSKQLLDLNKTLKELLTSTNVLVKQTKPPPNSKDDTYAKHKESVKAVVDKKDPSNSDKKPVGASLWDLGSAAFEAWQNRKNPNKTPKPRRGPSSIGGNSGKAWRVLKDAHAKGMESLAAKTGTTGKAVSNTASTIAQNADKAWQASKGAGTKLLDAAKPVANTISNNASKAWQAVKGVGTSAIDAGKGLGKGAVKLGGKLLGASAVPLTVGMGAYEAYGALNDDTKTGGEKAQGVAKAAGGTAGALAGGAYGATVGGTLGSVVPVVGTAIGGIAGGMIGGIGGYFGGGALVDGASSALSKAAEVTGIGDAIGASVALAMSPFSDDAANAVKQNLVPSLVATGDKFQNAAASVEKSTVDTLSAFSRSMTSFTDKLRDSMGTAGNAASSIWAGVKAAGSGAATTYESMKQGYKDGGIKESLKRGRIEARKTVDNVSDVVASANGTQRQFTDANGNVETRTGGSRAWRNNNEGNIRYGEFAKGKGAIGQDNDGFAIFAEAGAGAKAKESLLFEGKNYKNKSIDDAISRYAPSSENDTATYQKKVREAAGVSGSTRMSDLNPEQRAKVLATIKQHEGFKEGKTQYADASGKEITKDVMQLAKSGTQGGAQTKASPSIPSIVPNLKAQYLAQKATDDNAKTQAPNTSKNTPEVSPRFAQQSPVAVTSPSIQSVRQDPMQRVAASTPVETRPVQVANSSEMQPDFSKMPAPQVQTVAAQSSGTVPDIDSVPLQLTDMGLVLLNIGAI